MKFKFCGNLDCPDWVLAKILMISKLSTSDLKLISNEVLNDLLEGQLDFCKVAKHLEEYKFKEADCNAAKGILAAVTFIFKSSSKYTCDHEVLSNELQQLGLHREGAQIMSRIYQSKLKELRRVLEQNSFRVNKLTNIDWNIKNDFKCDDKTENRAVLHCSTPLVELKLDLESNSKVEKKSLILTPDKLLVLSMELKKIKKTMQRINSEL